MSRIKTDFICKPCPVGESVRIRYNKKIDEYGNSVYTPVAEIDIQEEIQSYKDTCSLANMLSRLHAAPSEFIVQSLNQTETYEGDFSNVPKDLVGCLEMFKDISSKYPELKNRMRSESIEDIISSLKNNLANLQNRFNSNENIDNKESIIKEDSNNGSI